MNDMENVVFWHKKILKGGQGFEFKINLFAGYLSRHLSQVPFNR